MVLASALSSALIGGVVSSASAQPVTGNASVSTASTQTRLEGTASDPRVTVGRGVVGCRALLSEIARLSRMEVRNLGRVPDERVYVEFSREPLGSAVSKLLAYAKVDYVLRSGGPSERPLLIVAEPAKAPTSASAEQPAAPPMTTVPAAVTEATTEGPPVIALEDPVEEVQLGPAPAWQPVDVAPQEVELPPDMVPNGFPVTAPPPVPAKGARPVPTPQPPKH